MGSPASKIGQEVPTEEFTEGSLPSTPILTPKMRIIDLDPRSPSTNIVRTPIQVLLTPNRQPLNARTESLNSGITNERFNTLQEALTKNIDPRSPTTDFARTPVLVAATPKALPLKGQKKSSPTDITRTPVSIADNPKSMPIKIYNKNLDNVRRALSAYTPPNIHGTKDSPIPNKIIPPRLLQSTVTSKPVDDKRKSFVGLLETNIDFEETDLDVVIQSKTPTRLKDESAVPEVAVNYSTQEENIESAALVDACESENIDVHVGTAPKEIIEEIDQIDLNKKEHGCRNCPYDQIKNSEELKDVEVTDIDDDGLKVKVINLSGNTGEFPGNDVKIKEKDSVIVNSKDFDKKLTNLIYEDQDANTVIRNTTVIEGNRTPLGTRNSNTDSNPRKSAPKLKVRDKPRKLDKELSRIPVLKDKRIKGRVSQQCENENIPPKSMEDFCNSKTKQQWDPNSTLII